MEASTVARKVLVALGLALSLALSSATPVRAADPYVIHVVLPLTGFAAFVGQTIVKTLSIVEETTNKQGGIRGQPIKFVTEDDQSSPAVAVQLTNGIIAKHPPAFLGSTISAMCQAQMTLLKDGPVQWCFSPVIRPAAGSYTFTTLHETEDYVVACLRFSLGRGWHKIAVINTTDASGQDFEASFDRVIGRPEFRAINVVARDRFNIADISAAAQVSRVKSSGAEAVLAWPTGTAIGTWFRGMQDAGLDLPTFTTPANGIFTLIRSLGSLIPTNLYFTGTSSYAPNMLPAGPVKQAVFQYIDGLRAHGMVPDQSTVASWDPPVIMIQALRKYGTNASPAQIREFIANYRGPGIIGMYDFRAHPQRGLDSSTVLIVRWDKTRQDWVGVSKFGGEPLSGS